MTLSLVPQPACLARESDWPVAPIREGRGIGMGQGVESSGSGLGGFPGVLVPPLVSVGSRLRTNIKLKCLFVNGQCQIFGGRGPAPSPDSSRGIGMTGEKGTVGDEGARRVGKRGPLPAHTSSRLSMSGPSARGGEPSPPWSPSPPRGTRGRLLGPLRERGKDE